MPTPDDHSEQMTSDPPSSDRECLQALRDRERAPAALAVLVERYLPLVFNSALRRIGDQARAEEISRSVFLVLARRGRKLSRKTILARWLFDITRLASKKAGLPRQWRWFGWFRRRPKADPGEEVWPVLAPHLDRAFDRLPPRLRAALLVHLLLGYDSPSGAQVLRISERRLGKRSERALKRSVRLLNRFTGLRLAPADLASVIQSHGSAYAPTPEFAACLPSEAAQGRQRRPTLPLARRVLRSLAWTRWRRRTVFGTASLILFLAVTGATAWYIDSRTGHSRLIAWWLEWSVRGQADAIPELKNPAKPWPGENDALLGDATQVRGAADLYQTTNIWAVHLRFSRDAWDDLEPNRIGPLPNFMRDDGTIELRNPKAQRSGLSGVLGFDFNFVQADFDFGGRRFTNVAARIKGNGTYLASLYGDKRAFKVDLNKFTKGQKLGGCDELNFNNLVVDQSYMSDALAYEFFREAGVPAPRTAYAYLTVTAEGEFTAKPYGLYVMVQPVDEVFAAEHFGSPKAPIFKPVTYDLFAYLGETWSAYEDIYDLKTKANAAQQRRLIELARLVSQADDPDFASAIGDFIDLPTLARFLGGQVILSCYDGLLSNGQNFYLYLDPRSNKFGFIPWDLDLAWGSFFLIATTEKREQASIWQPWVGQNKFLERMMRVPSFKDLYRAELERLLAEQFVPERLSRRIDALGQIIREPIAAESNFRLTRFDQAISDKWPARPPRPAPGQHGPDRPVHHLKRFLVKRAASVREQLDGKSKGVVLAR